MTLKLNGIFRRSKGQDIVHRWEGNPLIGLSDLDFQVSDIHNASAVDFQDQPLLLVTIETLSGQRCVHLARPNKDGIIKVDSKPFLKPSTDPSFLQHEINGVLDARATFLDGTYYIMYNALVGYLGTPYLLIFVYSGEIRGTSYLFPEQRCAVHTLPGFDRWAEAHPT
jgi:predicted GH43/DUF377 family glycosyl hydrolase